MSLLKTCAKQVVFFGFLIACSTSMVSAMFCQENKEPVYKCNFLTHNGEYGLHEAAVWGNFKKVQELCAQEDGRAVINVEKMIGNRKARTPIYWALESLVKYYPFQEKIIGEKSKAPHAFEHDFILTIRELIKHHAVIDLKKALSEALKSEQVRRKEENDDDDMVIDEKEVDFMYQLIMQQS